RGPGRDSMPPPSPPRMSIARLSSWILPYSDSRVGPAPRCLRRGALGARWRRATGGANGEKEPARDDVDGDGAAGVGEIGCAGHDRRRRISADETRRARGAVRRGFEVAEEVVMLEGSSDQEDGVDGHAHKRVGSAATPCRSRRHLELDNTLFALLSPTDRM